MCGIAGMMRIDGTAPDAAVIDRMAEAIAHRGPDGRGDHVQDDVAMMQVRLAIIDLKTGDQPLYDQDGAALVANGEIYNYIELREDLHGVNFKTASDCELPLHLYRGMGLDYVSKLRGMYAIAIHDPAAKQLVLSRDPFGIKPLYYAETADGFVFASEAGAVHAAIGRNGVHRPALDELLQLQFTTGARTIYPEVRRVLPGETLVVSAGRIVERRQQNALPEGGADTIDADRAVMALDEVLEESVMLHQRSDVPYGMFLSGGIDSSAVLALMARLNDRPVRAYTIGFPDTSVHDERAHARALAASVGAEHVEVDFCEADFWTLLPQVAAALDDPTADYATLPTFKLAAEAGKDLKVILSGEGGDELFAGYGRYRSVMRPWWRGGRIMRAKGVLDGFDVLRESTPAWRDGIHAAEIHAAAAGGSKLQGAQATDCADWLPNDLLTKLDRCLMAHGVEGRVPFLDPMVARTAFRLPDKLKIRGRLGKWALRNWLDTALPAAEPFTRKRGFTVPVGEWIAARGAELGPLVAAQPGIAEVCRPHRVADLFKSTGKREGFAAWVLLFYALWHQHHIVGAGSGAPDAFEALTAKG